MSTWMELLYWNLMGWLLILLLLLWLGMWMTDTPILFPMEQP